MKKLTTALLFLTVVCLHACRKVTGEGPVKTETRTATDFSGISLGAPVEVIYTPSNEYRIEIEAQQNIIDVIQTYVSHHELRLRLKDNTIIRPSEQVRVTVSAPYINSLAVSGSGSVKALQPVSSTAMKLSVSGSGSILLNSLQTGALEADISGSGEMQVLNGSADHEDIQVSGSGRIDLTNLLAQTAKTETSGSGSIKIYVEKTLDAHISGSGSVYYKGSPTVSSHVSGSGRIEKL